MKWFIVDQGGEEIPHTRGKSKTEAQDEFRALMQMLKGENKPWVWWTKQGYKVRRD